MSDREKKAPARSRSDQIAIVILVVFVTLFLACSGFITALEAPFHLVFGWAWHAWATFPALIPRWNETLLPLACLALALWLAHRFIRWWLAAKGSAIGWHSKHTIFACGLLLLGAAAAIATSGIVHQAVWLADEPWYERSGLDGSRTRVISNAKQVLLAVDEFRRANGRYPDSLDELSLPATLTTAVPLSGGAAEPFVYLKPAPDHPAEEEILLLVSPMLRADGRWVGGFSTGNARVFRAEEFIGLLESRRVPQRETP
jgi:hypothetical protein